MLVSTHLFAPRSGICTNSKRITFLLVFCVECLCRVRRNMIHACAKTNEKRKIDELIIFRLSYRETFESRRFSHASLLRSQSTAFSSLWCSSATICRMQSWTENGSVCPNSFNRITKIYFSSSQKYNVIRGSCSLFLASVQFANDDSVFHDAAALPESLSSKNCTDSVFCRWDRAVVKRVTWNTF